MEPEEAGSAGPSAGGTTLVENEPIVDKYSVGLRADQEPSVSAPVAGCCMSTDAMQSLYDMRQNNLLCDAVLRLEDGTVFSIHRAILSACSIYFRCGVRGSSL